ncbi:hypothetical protein GJAV_G00238870 [Gymnothorax javanicus]|nr:hypothetical protein GJAV_G00238870 [Gymnothorax javanicus]
MTSSELANIRQFCNLRVSWKSFGGSGMSLLRVFTIPSKHVICKCGLGEFVLKASSRMAGSAAGEKDKKPLRKPKTPVGRFDASEQETSKDVLERFPDDVNPVTKEKGGPKGPEPTRFGPRWAAWNLGVFICIRCAGIHRNLGVHISRVKSVNLDQWTPEQIQSMQDMGNSRARQLYEALLPCDYRRPQTDQAVEFFIRDKYERKKYTDKNAADAILKDQVKKDEKKRDKDSERGSKPSSLDKPQKRNELPPESHSNTRKTGGTDIDLLGLEAPVEGVSSSFSSAAASADLDIFGPMVSNPLPPDPAHQVCSSKAPAAPPSTGQSAPAPSDLDRSSESSGKVKETVKKPHLMSKDSILSLYSSGSTGNSQPATLFIGSSQMQIPPMPGASCQGYPSPPTSTMGQRADMMMPNGSMGAGQGEVMGVQHPQWNMGQMSEMSLNEPGGAAGGAASSAAEGWVAPPSGQTLSTQLWK